MIRLFTKQKGLIAFIMLCLLFSVQLLAQTASSITDEQIVQIVAAAKQRGMSTQEVAAYAKSRGYSDADVNAIIQRANSLNLSSLNSSSQLGVAGLRQMVQMDKSDFMKPGTSDSSSALSMAESKIFGYDVFHNKSISFSPNANMATPKDYIVGPGDELVIQVYGIAQATINARVSPEGKVVIPNVGVAHVGALSIDAVKSLLTQKMGTRYAGLSGTSPSSFIMVTLSNIRTIKVNLVGELKVPGTFELPAFTTIFNALYAAGGPNTNGSFRNVQLYRANKLIAEVDLYEFLLKGKKDKNIRLEDNDVLLVPKYVKRVEVAGELRRNLFFEIKDKETLADLIEMAGGYTETAYKKMLTVQRLNGVNKSILNITDKELNKTFIEDGDYVSVGKMMATYKNRVQLVGAVIREGDYELEQNTRIADLISTAGGLKGDAFTKRAILYRTNAALEQEAITIDLAKALQKEASYNVVLQKEDLLVVSSIYDIKENYFVTINGEVNQTGVFPYVKGMTIGNLILSANGFKEAASGASIELVRRVKDDNNKIANVINVQIEKDLSISDADKNIAIEPFDQIYVRAAMGYKPYKKVFVQGEAAYPGQFIIDRPNMTVGDLMKRAGGALPSSNIKGALLIRRTIYFHKVSNENDYINKLEELKQRYIDSTKSGFNEAASKSILKIDNELAGLKAKKNNNQESILDIGNLSASKENKTKADSVAKNKIKSEQDNIEDLKTALQARIFKNLKDVTINEDQYQFVSINLEKIVIGSNTKDFDLQLQEGDILYIPTYNETVLVSGDVLYPVAVKYTEEGSLKDYVNQAGGFNNTALKRKAYVVEANGVVKRTHSFLGLKFYPTVSAGAQIFVPKNNKPATNLSIDRVLGLTSSLVTTYLLIQNLTK